MIYLIQNLFYFINFHTIRLHFLIIKILGKLLIKSLFQIIE